MTDFADGSLRQLTCNLGEAQSACQHAAVLTDAQVIFVDGPKDGVFERSLLANLHRIGVKPGTLLILDDIRLWRMLDIWRKIAKPKLDVTSLGHYTGTGLVEWR
jgi:hypothetical protein